MPGRTSPERRGPGRPAVLTVGATGGLERVAPYQNDSFPPNCITRAPTDVLVIFPNVAASMLALGLLKDGWLNALKASARKVKRSFSAKENVLNSDRSVVERPGPRRMLRPALP